METCHLLLASPTICLRFSQQDVMSTGGRLGITLVNIIAVMLLFSTSFT